MSKRGERSVGVKTLTVTDEDYIDPFTGESTPRSLKVEVWYPTDQAGADDAVYTHYRNMVLTPVIK